MGLEANLDICAQVYGIDATYASVDFTNAYYGSDQPRGTRIVFVNGVCFVVDDMNMRDSFEFVVH